MALYQLKMMERVIPFVPVIFMCFVIYLMVDGTVRFRKSEQTARMQQTYALMMTMLTIFAVLLIGATLTAAVEGYPRLAELIRIKF